jgi:hypothetical protein
VITRGTPYLPKAEYTRMLRKNKKLKEGKKELLLTYA